MLRNRDFIVFSDDWGRHPFSCQHLMEYFLPYNKVLWVHTIGLRTPRLSWYDAKRSVEKLLSWLRPGPKTDRGETSDALPPNLRIVSPVMVPFNNIAAVRAWNRASVVRSVTEAMQAWGMCSPILLATLPNASDYLGLLGEKIAVYYCVDDFVHWPGMNQPELVHGMEQALLKKADLVVVTSQALRETRQGPKAPAKLLTHGVDLRHFFRGDTAKEPPEALRELRSPVIGFYGLLDGRLDVRLIQELLERKPDWNFLFIGKSLISLESLEKYPGFHHIPHVAYEVLPDYAACFDVAIIPYLVDERTVSVNPLKLREYLATGKPVVSTPLPEAANLAPEVRIGKDAGEFIREIEAGLKEDPGCRERRLASLQGHLWSDKAELLSSWIEEALAAKCSEASTPDSGHKRAGEGTA